MSLRDLFKDTNLDKEISLDKAHVLLKQMERDGYVRRYPQAQDHFYITVDGKVFLEEARGYTALHFAETKRGGDGEGRPGEGGE